MSTPARRLRTEGLRDSAPEPGPFTLFLSEGEFNIELMAPDEWLVSFVPRSNAQRRVRVFFYAAGTQDRALDVLSWVRAQLVETGLEHRRRTPRFPQAI